jgi:phage FluMu protein Com
MTCPKCNKEIIEADIEVTKVYCNSCKEWFSIKTDVSAENMSKDAPTQKKKSFWGGGFIGPLDLKYEEIPFYRKRWFLVLLFLFFIPALIIIDLSGDTYAFRNGKVYKYDNHLLAKIAGIFMGVGIIRVIMEIIFSFI